MSIALGQLTLTPNKQQTFSCPNSGIAGLLIGNLSGYLVSITLEGAGISKSLYPGFTDFFPTRYGFSGTVFINSQGTLPNTLNYPGNILQFDAVGLQENINMNAYPLSNASVQAVSPTASGKPKYGASYIINPTTANVTILNIWNDFLNTPIIYTFYSAIIYTNDTVPVNARIYFNANGGVDLNFGTAITTSPHRGQFNPPASTAHATAEQAASIPAPTFYMENYELPNSIPPYDMLSFPDDETLYVGGNLGIAIVHTTTGHIDMVLLKWTEG